MALGGGGRCSELEKWGSEDGSPTVGSEVYYSCGLAFSSCTFYVRGGEKKQTTPIFNPGNPEGFVMYQEGVKLSFSDIESVSHLVLEFCYE